MRPTWTILGLASIAIAALSGCGGEARDATSKELSALTAEISKLRAEQAAMAERLSGIERGKLSAPADPAVAGNDAPDAAPSASARSLDADRPALDVVRLGPTDDAGDADDDVDTDGPRTILRSGANGIIVEEQSGPGAPARPVAAEPKKPAPKKTDKAGKKTAALPTP